MLPRRFGLVDDDDLGLRSEGGAEAESEIERNADDERDVGSAEPVAARAGEEAGMVGGQAPAGQPVEKHGDAQLIGDGTQLVLAPPPVQPGPGHDHGPLRVGE